MLRAVEKKSWRRHPTKQQLYSNLPPIMKTIQIRRTRHAGHSWRSTDVLNRNVLLWTPSHLRTSVGRPSRTYIQQLCAATGYRLDDFAGAMDNRDGCWKRIRDIRARRTTWWWVFCPFFVPSVSSINLVLGYIIYVLAADLQLVLQIEYKKIRLRHV